MNNRRQVDKSKFLDGFTQEYLLSNTYKHKVEVENRQEERKKEAYKFGEEREMRDINIFV